MPKNRYEKTIKMLKTILKPKNTIFDLGVETLF